MSRVRDRKILHETKHALHKEKMEDFDRFPLEDKIDMYTDDDVSIKDFPKPKQSPRYVCT